MGTYSWRVWLLRVVLILPLFSAAKGSTITFFVSLKHLAKIPVQDLPHFNWLLLSSFPNPK